MPLLPTWLLQWCQIDTHVSEIYGPACVSLTPSVQMRRTSPNVAPKYRFTHGIAAAEGRWDPRIRSLAIELLCDAVPSGAIVLDARCRVIFANRQGADLLLRWNRDRGRLSTGSDVPPEIVAACETLRQGAPRGQRGRPKFGGRVFLRHPKTPTLNAVVALERSRRDRKVAVFCVLVQDRLKENLGAGRKDQLAMLTIAERGVAKLVAEGLRNSEIASALSKSVTTVKSQLGAIFRKLQVDTRTQLVALLRSA